MKVGGRAEQWVERREGKLVEGRAGKLIEGKMEKRVINKGRRVERVVERVRVRFGGAGDVDGDGGGWERGWWHLCGGVM